MADQGKTSFGDGATQSALRAWWEGLNEARGDRAELRRCRRPAEAVFCPAYHRLRRDLGAFQGERLALVAGLLAHVDEEDEDNPFAAEKMATPKASGDRARVSGLRFRRLLRIADDERDKLYEQMIRVLRMLDRKAGIMDLAQSVYWWNERTRKDWACRYYEKAPSEK